MKKLDSHTDVNTDEKFVLIKAESELMMTNNSPTNAIVRIYELYTRRDIEAVGDAEAPIALWSQGLVAQGINYHALSARPFDSNLFCETYLVTKVFNVELAPGKTHIHKSTYYYNRMIENTLIQKSLGGVRGLTRNILITAKGTPISEVETPGQITTSQVKIDCVLTKSLVYTYVSPLKSKVEIYSTLADIKDTDPVEVVTNVINQILTHIPVQETTTQETTPSEDEDLRHELANYDKGDMEF
jgi:hypothetical protein